MSVDEVSNDGIEYKVYVKGYPYTLLPRRWARWALVWVEDSLPKAEFDAKYQAARGRLVKVVETHFDKVARDKTIKSRMTFVKSDNP